MPGPQIRFEDGAAYERMMGTWSRLVGSVFLDWLAPAPGLRWVDVGCGNGAFTEMLIERCAPAGVQGIDPSEAQLAFARSRPGARMAQFHRGDAMALPFADRSADALVMALVIFFVPDPAKGVAEMIRVARPGGLVSAYVWDVHGGGLPMDPIQAAMRSIGTAAPLPPSSDVSRLSALRDLWSASGLADVRTTEIAVERTFAGFDEFWTTTLTAGGLAAAIATMPPDQQEQLKAAVRARLPPDAAGRITCTARANAAQGRVRA
jgi:ubiquinone/menaquinone biosynthesis C-methylase UbiE